MIDHSQYHVAKNGSDSHEGSAKKPFLTIQRAADVALPGDTITVHEGIYRERVNPPRGGTSVDKRIKYHAASGEKVVIKGSEIVTGWQQVQDEVWKVVLPNAFFGKFNPFDDLIRGDWFDDNGRDHHTGAVYLDGHWLIEAAKKEELFNSVVRAQAQSDDLFNLAWMCTVGKGKNKVSAADFSGHRGGRKKASDKSGEYIGSIKDGDWLHYSIDFGESTEHMEFRVASDVRGGIIEMHLNSPDGELIGMCTVPATGGGQEWRTIRTDIAPLSGRKDVYLVFRAKQAGENTSPLWFAEADETSTTLWAQFKGVDPNKELVEVNARQSVFYPSVPGINYISVRGFTLEHAATPWAPPTAEQIGLIGTHWSKGWIVEDNVIRYSTCVGLTLGKYGDEFDNKSATADAFNRTIDRALENGWNKDNIGSHIIRNNHISHCEQAGIVGSLGACFSTIEGNEIHDVHVRWLYAGAELAGIKFHAPIDTLICGNHIYRCWKRGIWLDWMSQGTRISGNLLHDNAEEDIEWSKNWNAIAANGHQDLFMEVNHGPFVVDNNLFLSVYSLNDRSQGGVYAHNIFAGAIRFAPNEKRQTPFHKVHSTELAGLHDHPGGDDRFYNNWFVKRGDLSAYDHAEFPISMGGNLYFNGAKPSKYEAHAVIETADPAIQLIEEGADAYLEFTPGPSHEKAGTVLVTTEMLGLAKVPQVPFEDPDGSPITLDRDYLGRPRNAKNPSPGPFEISHKAQQRIKVWPIKGE